MTNRARTETGLLMSSAYRPRGDKAWNYLRPPPHVLPYIRFEPLEKDKYECVVLDGHKGKTMSNSDLPEPNSWRTSDLFEPHATIPNAWKFVSRMDDRIALINGEKVLPLTFESRIRQDALVKEAVVFGIDREVPGLLLFRAVDTPREMSNQQFLYRVWPSVASANSQADAFSQVISELVIVAPEHRECPTTDKNSVKRGQVYKEFAAEIEAAYEAVLHTKANSLRLSESDLCDWILDAVRSQGYPIESALTEFFSLGMDSLQATDLRGRILRNIDLGGHGKLCTPMIVFECGNAQRLARRLCAIHDDDGYKDQPNKNGHSRDAMKALIEKYSNFEQLKTVENVESNKTVVVSLNNKELN